VHNNLGIALRELGHLDKAVTSYRKALGLKPDLPTRTTTSAMRSGTLENWKMP